MLAQRQSIAAAQHACNAFVVMGVLDIDNGTKEFVYSVVVGDTTVEAFCAAMWDGFQAFALGRVQSLAIERVGRA